MKNHLKINVREAHIIQHRLDVPCSLRDALEEEYNLTFEYVQEVCLRFEKQLKQGFIEYTNENEKAIFEDTLEGATCLVDLDIAAALMDMTEKEKASWLRARTSLMNKTSLYIPLS